MNQCYLLALGSNEQAEQRLVDMVEALLAEFGPLWLSPVCRTRAVGDVAHDYLNAVVSFESQRLPCDVKASCRQIENNLGRVRPSRWCAADIDILACWNDQVPTGAVQFVQESYLQPMVDVLLRGMGLHDGSDVAPCDATAELTLASGQVIGLEVLALSTQTEIYDSHEAKTPVMLVDSL